ncbi:MAG TPA: PKD domain-containing protein [Candidatus Paceibacterota bacterium]|nr:PKD domain-containing protein [Candidatus Paceibacterota bacterium]
MIKKLVFAGVGVALLVSPLIASAQTGGWPGQQDPLIAYLEQLIQLLEQELQILTGGFNYVPVQTFSVSPTSGTAPLTVTFVNVGSSIDFGDGSGINGSTGAVIGTSVHTYANGGTYIAVSGGMTVTIVVIGTQPLSATLSASPQSGPAPLAVYFNEQAPPAGQLATTINFGDGTSGTLNPAPVCFGCSQVATGSHTYSSSGIYTATAGAASVTVTVSGTSPSLTFTASPTSGQAPLAVSFSAPIGEALANPPTTYAINFGDGQSGSMQIVQGASSASLSAGYTYSSAGTYTATLTATIPCSVVGCTPTSQVVGTATVTVAPQKTSCTILDCVAGYHPSGPSCSSNQTCVPDAQTSCSWNSGTIPSGTSVTAYQTTYLGGGANQCTWEARTCTNGVLSGDSSYQYASCSTH